MLNTYGEQCVAMGAKNTMQTENSAYGIHVCDIRLHGGNVRNGLGFVENFYTKTADFRGNLPF